jgi:hypothetical protein
MNTEMNTETKKSCDNGECKGGRAFAVAHINKVFCSAGCLNKGLNLKPTDEDYWSEEEDDDEVCEYCGDKDTKIWRKIETNEFSNPEVWICCCCYANSITYGMYFDDMEDTYDDTIHCEYARVIETKVGNENNILK